MPSDADNGAPLVPILCSECETRSRIPLTKVAETIERHNEQLHDGAEIAEVDPDVKEGVADLIVEELGLLDEPE